MNNIKIALCFFLMTAICLPGSANENPARSTRKIMNSYRGEKGFFAFSVPVFMAKIALSGEDQEVKDMLRDVMSVVRGVPNGRGLGVFYWDATWTSYRPVGQSSTLG